jgi:hypothetical protein
MVLRVPRPPGRDRIDHWHPLEQEENEPEMVATAAVSPWVEHLSMKVGIPQWSHSGKQSVDLPPCYLEHEKLLCIHCVMILTSRCVRVMYLAVSKVFGNINQFYSFSSEKHHLICINFAL